MRIYVYKNREKKKKKAQSKTRDIIKYYIYSKTKIENKFARLERVRKERKFRNNNNNIELLCIYVNF